MNSFSKTQKSESLSGVVIIQDKEIDWTMSFNEQMSRLGEDPLLEQLPPGIRGRIGGAENMGAILLSGPPDRRMMSYR